MATNRMSTQSRLRRIPTTGRIDLFEDLRALYPDDVPPMLIPYPNLPRSREELAPELKRVMNGLVAGKLPWPLFLHGAAGRGKTCAGLLMIDTVPGSSYCLLETLVGCGTCVELTGPDRRME